MISTKLRPFGTTIFSEMTRLANEAGAVNLAQGFPDFDGPEAMKKAVVRALDEGKNQYARSQGLTELVAAIAKERARTGLVYDPMTEVGVFAGATEGIAAAVLGMIEPGDEVILFEPFYDSYPACLAMAGAVPRCYTLRFPDFEIERERLAALFSSKTRAIILNTPHNPTGKVMKRAELEIIAELAKANDVFVITDEVYEHLVYGDAVHLPIAAIDGMRERTISLSSVGKTFSYTGWKIGWATGPQSMIAAAQSAHQFLTFAVSTPMQAATAWALENIGADFFRTLESDYRRRRDYLGGVLTDCGFRIARTEGAYFILAEFSRLSKADDQTFVRELIKSAGVAAIPPSVFYSAEKSEGQKLLRFAFCKKDATLEEAAARLRRYFR